ncbi:MAG: GGDEF domain-containing protein [gamma proteobacterium symbiont of Bathyaustriella thionipta]|nr:GGDEF domain-containing protein [gamma proteobacterium symbiont of Bathyaustriella thionipta]MCU7951538.1 GGDEF domain-containing protein [gamma proteobacterium symbiont of Bathyaustriella thionipta]MCU7954454.1 GGDEF domain-containing protein [gamma proteobacterium symbiont of Bathyaustriella thionipta]MCU7958118.1 GGDEF domain-containing protein [gamma proteobacterium symbiont of Bathyaustriella thionipta]MCU7966338.1 GGDEF domain-containing protein [gamma proteobacterium symbiont of Bathy
MALLYIDLDKFKPINDTLGHAVGDEVLKTIAKRLRKSIRAVDSVARIGGDEFIILMESVSNLEDVKSMAKKLNRTLQQPIHLNSCNVPSYIIFNSAYYSAVL